MSRPLLLGRGGDWPFAGHFRGRLGRVAWAGCVAVGDDLAAAWRVSRVVDGALCRKGPPTADRRRALSIMWARLDGVVREVLGPGGGDDLALLLTAEDDEGAAVSAVGIGALYALFGGHAEPWVIAPHPLLGPPGLPARRPGAMTVDHLPDWVVAVEHGRSEDLDRVALDALLGRCGVTQ
ncbi:MAG: hypothetical protein JRI25_18205 [Deltaproteobacteria bacterium]|nr:hypothetical protein [Deltaproteobacteria bacterium]MBW2256510.1 hypothetical protein [Deltaproteobacteria bacterium]